MAYGHVVCGNCSQKLFIIVSVPAKNWEQIATEAQEAGEMTVSHLATGPAKCPACGTLLEPETGAVYTGT